MNYWAEVSINVINQIYRENQDKDKKSIVKLIDAAYPFGNRANHPYKIWLQERKRLLFLYNLYEAPKSRKCKYHPNAQTCLFCKNK